jgi:hypothetical protein
MTVKATFALGATLLLVATVSLGACESEPPPPGPALIQVDRETKGDVPVIDNPTGIILGTAIRRMTLAELDKSVGVAAGTAADGSPIFWKALAGIHLSALDDRAYGPVLGKPDYVSLTEEDPTPSPLYAKFVQDLSRDVCAQMTTADATRPASEPKVLWPFAPVESEATAEQVQENLGYLLLRFLGLEGDEAEERLGRLHILYGAAKADAANTTPASAQVVAWGVVCIALFEDPAFHLH